MHLTMNLGLGGVINLIWDHYEGFNFGTYYIYRGTLTLPLDSIYAIASNNHSWTDLNPPVTPELFYQVAAVHPTGCQPTFFNKDQKKVLIYNSARSNVSNRLVPTGINLQPSISNLQLKVYPNPNTGEFTLEINLTETQDILLTITNILGQQVYSEKYRAIKGTYQTKIDLSSYANGIYNVQLLSKEGIINKKIILE